MKHHKTKDGNIIQISKLETSHLENIIKRIEKIAKEGIKVSFGGGCCAEDMWYDEETLKGEKAKKHLNFYDYQNELNSRKNK
jgi:hypothetical protein